MVFVKPQEKTFFEYNIMSLGTGLALFPAVSIFLNKIGLPIDWKLYLAIGLIIPIIDFFIKLRKKQFKLLSFKESPWFVLAAIGFIFLSYVLITGAFVIPYLEDGDPYEYAVASKYIAYEKTYSKDNLYISHYLAPYPPAYAGLMGLIHQTNTDLLWTLKFFNALIISLAVFFSYYLFKLIFNSPKIAGIGAFGLAMMPCFSSHFIFSQSLSITLFFPVFYMLFCIKNNKWWFIPAGAGIAGFIVTQTSTAMGIAGFIALFLLLLLPRLKEDNNRYVFCAAFAGLLIGLTIFWIPALIQYEYADIQMQLTMGNAEYRNIIKSSDFFAAYTFSDFFYSAVPNKIDNPVGFGPWFSIFILFGLVIAGGQIIQPLRNKASKIAMGIALLLIPCSILVHSWRAYLLFTQSGKSYIFSGFTIWLFLLISGFILLVCVAYINRKELFQSNKTSHLLLLLWFLWGVIGVLGDYFPFGWLPNRFWSLLAIPASLLFAYAAAIISHSIATAATHKFKHILNIAIILIILITITFSAGLAKKTINTSFWPQHHIDNLPELKGYLALQKNLPPESKVFDPCRKETLVSNNAFFPTWNKEAITYIYSPENTEEYGWDYKYIFNNHLRNLSQSQFMSSNENEIFRWLKENKFRYLVMSNYCNVIYPNDGAEITAKIDRIKQNKNFTLMFNQNNAFYLFELV